MAAQQHHNVAARTYAERAQSHTNPAARVLLETAERKRSNLCVSVDVTKKADLLRVVDAVGPDVCLIKVSNLVMMNTVQDVCYRIRIGQTHIDIVEDFDQGLVTQLQALSEKHDFLIFEDRKFADIGNTVSLQYSSGVHRIASWSHITNAHLVPGPGIISGLATAGLPLGRGLLLLAEMSSAGTLAAGDYTRACVRAARADKSGFVCGFIAMRRVDELEPPAAGEEGQDFVILTPGVGLDVKGDALGQQYRTPDAVVRESGCDIIIVGRGVYGALLNAKTDAQREEAFQTVREQGSRYKTAGWEAYLKRIGQQTEASSLPGTQTPAKRPASPNQLVEEKSSSAASSSRRQSKRRTLFAPHPPAPIAVKEWAIKAEPGDTSGDAALAASFATVEPSARYSLRRRIKAEDTLPDATASSSSSVSTPRASRTSRRSTAAESDADDEGLRDNSVSPRKGNGKGKEKAKAITTSEPLSPFSISPRKTSQKPIKLSLEPHEAHPAPEKWRETYEVLKKQRARIVAPVDTMGCEATSAKDEREETRQESLEEKEKRKRFTTLISLMLSSQTKDPVTAEAVRQLQTRLPGGLSLESLLGSTDELVQECIAKVGFWRRKTGYIKSAAAILKSDFNSDVPKTVDELCSLPGVGPKMAFLALQSAWNINDGIGVDVHVHRMTNRLGWHKTQTAEQTRLNLQSWLPKELHRDINKILVGFGQVICVPVGPRCDLCAVGAAGLCPSYRAVDPKAAAKRVKVELLEDETGSDAVKKEAKVEIEMDGPDGAGTLLADAPGTDHVEQQEPLAASPIKAKMEW